MKCPKCGSDKYAKILYGTPAIDDDFKLKPALQEKIDRKEIILGGCCKFPDSPKVMCLECKEKYDSEPYYIINEDANCFDNANYKDYRETVKSFAFSCGGYFNGYDYFLIEENNYIITLTITPSILSERTEISKEITYDEWFEFLDIIYSKLFIHEWNKEYVNNDILDGTQWSITFKLEDGKEIKYHGSNEYPAYWKEFLVFINKYAEFSGVIFKG